MKDNKHAGAHSQKKSRYEGSKPKRTGYLGNAKKEDQKDVEGSIFVTYGGTGFFDIPGTTNSIKISRENLGTALHGDTVIIKSYKRNRELYGEVTKIIKRKQLNFTGTIREDGGEFFMIPDNKRFYRPIKIHSKNKEEQVVVKKALGHKVYVKLTKWDRHDKDPEGEIIQIIGKKGEHETEMSAIILEKGFVKNFEKEIEKEADELPKIITEEQVALRRDFRKVTTFTIDPADAKDFDDAISMQIMPDGKYEIGVHIADVSHYVKIGGVIDDEAQQRSTSVYMVDRTIPMLPEVLCNDLCSLKPNVDRLAMSAVFVMDKNGAVHSRWFGKTVIHSAVRFTYETAQEVIDAGSGPLATELAFLDAMTKKIIVRRKKEGALSFNTEEVKFILDKNMVPTDVFAKVRTSSHEVIEELMILANNEVAHFIANYGKKGPKNHNEKNTHEHVNQKHTEIPTIYRVHGDPKKDKIEELKALLKLWGRDLHFTNAKSLAFALNKLQDDIAELPERTMINSMIIRSMEKAIYSTKNIGHYGLALDEYVHFTSPIRRYPDLIVHRSLDNILKNKPPLNLKRLDEIAKHSSFREKEAAEAERASIKYKQVEYMASRVGEMFTGVLVGMNDYTMFIEEARTKCEGMIKISELKSDNFVFDKKRMHVVGAKSKVTYTIGDKVKIKVQSVNLDDQSIAYEIVS